MRIVVYDVPNEGKGSLARDLWEFCYFEHHGLILDVYAHEERDNPRQKFRPRRAYNRLSHNRNRDHRIENVSEEQAPLPGWVKDQALEIFARSITVKKWSEK